MKPILVEVIEKKTTGLERIDEVTTITKEKVTKGTKYEIEYLDNTEKPKKIIIVQDNESKQVMIEDRQMVFDYVPSTPVVVKDVIDTTTKVKTVVYPTLETFQLD